MEIMIITEIKEDDGHYIKATCNSITAEVYYTSGTYARVNVICCNAAHKAFRGMGRQFESIKEAVAAYKKPEMKAIIQLLRSKP